MHACTVWYEHLWCIIVLKYLLSASDFYFFFPPSITVIAKYLGRGKQWEKTVRVKKGLKRECVLLRPGILVLILGFLKILIFSSVRNTTFSLAKWRKKAIPAKGRTYVKVSSVSVQPERSSFLALVFNFNMNWAYWTQHHRVFAMWPWASHFPSLALVFPICEMRHQD